MKKNRTMIGTLIAVILIILLLNPQWLPVSVETKEKIRDLEKSYFLIERSGRITVAHILTVLLMISVLWVINLVVKWIIQYFGKKSMRAQTIANLLAGTFHYLIVIIGVVWGLAILGVNTTAVLAGIGIVGLILGFGAQSLIEDIITGAFIIFEGQYVNGDIIILDDFRGTVRNIGVRTTTIEDAGGNLKIVNAHKDLYQKEPVFLGVTALADSGVNLKFIVDVREEDVFKAQRQLTRDIWALFMEKGIEIPFPQVVVHQG